MASLAFRVYQKTNAEQDFAVLLENKKTKNSILFQAGTVATLSQPETDAVRGDHYGRILDAYGCLGVLQYCPRENTELYLVVITRCIKVCNFMGSYIYKIQEVDIISLSHMRPPHYKPQNDDEGWMKEMKKILNNETFYFSAASGGAEALDLTLCAQRRAKTSKTDNRFFWNRMLHLHLKRFCVDTNQWLTKIMCGSIEFGSIYMNNHTPKILIISRLSCERAGTRFMVRGVNDNGHVANFVETEQLIHIDTMDDVVLSYLQTRGSVPLFWEQPGLNVGSHKIKMSREPAVSQQAFQKHMRFMRERYGQQVVINVLGTGVTGKSQGEAGLSHIFQHQHLACPWSKDSQHVVFDFHQECRGGNTENLSKKLKVQISKEIESFGYFCSRNGKVQSIQCGCMRTNCIDCLDRTNRVQTFLGLNMMYTMLQYLGVANQGIIVQRFKTKLEELWSNNGNRISHLYAGTGALQGSKLLDGARSAARTIQNNLLDSSKQEAIDILLHGNLLNNYLAALSRSLLPSSYLYAPISVLRQVCNRNDEYCQSIPLRVSVGTYNVNGGKHFRSLAYKHLSLDDWLLDCKKNTVQSSLVDTTPDEEEIDTGAPDVFAVGFEEIVDLNAQNIVASASTSDNAVSWGKEMEKVLSRDEKFVMVTWGQLVGVALFVYVNAKHANHVRGVSVESVKTGMQGTTGNKGAVGIRLVVRNTSMAFVCSHFAAGQKEINERNNDYETTARKMIFPLGIPLWAHDYVFWCGDFNYRINMGRDDVMDLVQRREWEQLLENDQLMISKNEGKCFKGFIEGEISFAPTYKYDLFSDDYDTSEKCRVPAWTDRVLFWRRQYQKDQNNPNWKPGRMVHYGRAELKQSDHRPVLSVIDIEGRTVDNDKLQKVYESVVESLGPSDCTVVVQVENMKPGVEADEVFDDATLEAVQEAMGTVGQVVLVRFVDNRVWFTFSHSQMALKAIASSPLKIGGHVLSVELKTEAWQEQLEEEMALCSENTVCLTDEVLNIKDADYDIETDLRNIEGVIEKMYANDYENEHGSSEVSDSKSGVSPTPSRPPPPRPTPSRPPPPRPTPPSSAPGSPAQQRAQQPKVFVITKPMIGQKPARPTELPSAVPSPLIGPPPSTDEAPNMNSSQTSPSHHKPLATGPPPPIPARTPSLESPATSSPPSTAASNGGSPSSGPHPGNTISGIFSGRPTDGPTPPSAPVNDSLFSTPPVPPAGLFGAPPPQPDGLPPPPTPPSDLAPEPPTGPPPLGPPPAPPSGPPSGPPPGPPPSFPTNGPPSNLPNLPARTLPAVPTRGPPPAIPSRTLPPVPARNLPPVPPRN